MANSPDKVLEGYRQFDVASSDVYVGNFINFGWWPSPLTKENLDAEDRLESEKNLYRALLKNLAVSTGEKILEIGCALGAGTCLIASEYRPQKAIGIDFSEPQILRAKAIHQEEIKKSSERLSYQVGNALDLPFEKTSLDTIISIETTQHISELDQFASECFRTLKPNGKIGIATYFSPTEAKLPSLQASLPTVKKGIDFLGSIEAFQTTLSKAGFKNVHAISVGEHIWRGFDRWIARGEKRESWIRNLVKFFDEGLLDYYFVTASK